MFESLSEAIRQLQWTETGAVAAGVVYVVLAARENSWCWLFGIIGSGLSIYLFFLSKLYAESILYLYYVAAGAYGWYAWTHERQRKPGGQMAITVWTPRRHLLAIALGVILSLILAWILRTFTDARLPLIDAHTTIFSFIATFLVTRKVLSNWIYWIAIDAVSVGLYASRGLYLYALLMAAYAIIAVWGYGVWRREYLRQERGNLLNNE